jgi:hypothetical protein
MDEQPSSPAPALGTGAGTPTGITNPMLTAAVRSGLGDQDV